MIDWKALAGGTQTQQTTSSQAGVGLVNKDPQGFDNNPIVPNAKRFTPITSDLKFVKDGFTKLPTVKTRIAGSPNMPALGQYYNDPSQPDTLFKGERGYDNRDNKLYRGGLPSRLLQIDHIMPLWAGGADTIENRQNLSIADHVAKTKVDAVARTLYYAKKISLNEARVMAINWKDKDLTGIPNLMDSKLDAGVDKTKIPVDLALAKKIEWGKPKKVGIKDWWNEIKTGTTLQSAIPGPIGQALQGFASGVTGGWLPSNVPESTDDKDNLKMGVANMGGQIIGTIASFLTGGAVLRGAKLGTKALGAARAAGLTRLADSVEGVSSALSTAAKTGRPVFQAGKISISGGTAQNILRDVGLFSTIGQLSKQEENTFAERSKRFFTDVATAGLLHTNGVKIPLTKLKAPPSAGIAAGTYVISALGGASASESAINAGVMVGLHGIGKIGSTAKIDALANKAAADSFTKWDIEINPNKTYGINEIINKRQQAIQKIYSRMDSPSEAQKEVEKIIIAGRQLYKGGLAVEKRASEDWADTITLIRRTNDAPKIDKVTDIPDSAYLMARKMSDNKSRADLNETQASSPFESSQNGRVISTGVSEKVAPDTAASIKKFMKNGGKEGDQVFAYLKDDQATERFIRAKNMSRRPEDQINPKNNIVIFALDKEGTPHNLGWWPSEKRITKSGTGINEKMSSYELPVMDPAFNKDNIAEEMRKSGTKIISGQIAAIGEKSKTSGQPWVHMDFSDLGSSASFAKTFTNSKYASQALRNQLPTADNMKFAQIIETFENIIASGKKPMDIRASLKDQLGININNEQLQRVVDNKIRTISDFTVLFKSSSKDATGKSLDNLLFGKDSFFEGLNPRELKHVSKMMLPKYGENPQAKVPTRPKVDEAVVRKALQEMPTKSSQPKTPQVDVKGAAKAAKESKVLQQEPLTTIVKSPKEGSPQSMRLRTEVAVASGDKEAVQKNLIDFVNKIIEINPKARTPEMVDAIRKMFSISKKLGTPEITGKYQLLLEKVERMPSTQKLGRNNSSSKAEEQPFSLSKTPKDVQQKLDQMESSPDVAKARDDITNQSKEALQSPQGGNLSELEMEVLATSSKQNGSKLRELVGDYYAAKGTKARNAIKEKMKDLGLDVDAVKPSTTEISGATRKILVNVIEKNNKGKESIISEGTKLLDRYFKTFSTKDEVVRKEIANDLKSYGLHIDDYWKNAHKLYTRDVKPKMSDLAEGIHKSKETAKSPKIKLLWKNVIDELDKILPGWDTKAKTTDKGALGRLTSDVFSAGESMGKEITVNPKIQKWASIIKMSNVNPERLSESVKTGDIPVGVVKLIKDIKEKYPKTKIYMQYSNSQPYPKKSYYNIYEDLNKFLELDRAKTDKLTAEGKISKAISERLKSRYKEGSGLSGSRALTDSEMSSVKKGLDSTTIRKMKDGASPEEFNSGIDTEEIMHLARNTKLPANMEEQVSSSTIAKILSPFEDLTDLSNKEISLIASDLARVLKGTLN